MRAYDEIDFLEAVLEIKRSQVSGVTVLRVLPEVLGINAFPWSRSCS